jgi:5-methyltetrahydrofolate--homocysteine methyltransferase
VEALLLAETREAVADLKAGQLSLLDHLERLERVLEGLRLLPASERSSRGLVVLASAAGDVHEIGRAQLSALLEGAGYEVLDLGRQVPIGTIADAVERRQPVALGLTALLASSSEQMPACLAELDRRGLRVPVLVGGAALTKGFERRIAHVSDGRRYEPGAFYCRDVFEGLAVLDALTGTQTGRQQVFADLTSRVNAEHIETARKPVPAGEPLAPAEPTSFDRWGITYQEIPLADLWPLLDRNTLFRYHWGGYTVPREQYEQVIANVFEPRLAQLKVDPLLATWLKPRVATGYFPCQSEREELAVFDPGNPRTLLAQIGFPRQPDGDRLCLADYFSTRLDVLPLQAVTMGAGALAKIARLRSEGQLREMTIASGLAAGLAEALAEFAFRQVQRDLRLPPERGLRFSWGYPACPEVRDQRFVLPLLAIEKIGLRVTESGCLDPEHSTAALVVHHPSAKYFAVRAD